MIKVYMGWDSREVEAYDVAVRTLRQTCTQPVQITPLKLRNLELFGLMRRPWKRLAKGTPTLIGEGHTTRVTHKSGQLFDEISRAPMSTEFALTRFLTPLLAQTGWAVFVDCDVVFLGDLAELIPTLDPDFPLYCVQHAYMEDVAPQKMNGQINLAYRRKNWSSFMIFNCSHPANRFLNLEMINSRPGRELHAFEWLHGFKIGTLPSEWNWLVNVQPRPEAPKLAHFTLGGPWLENWQRAPHDDIWLGASQDCGSGTGARDARRSAGAV